MLAARIFLSRHHADRVDSDAEVFLHSAPISGTALKS
jgi:hypothetical protein